MKQRLLVATTKAALCALVAFAGFASPLLGMDVPRERKKQFTLKVINEASIPYKLGMYECAPGWASSLTLGAIGHQYCDNINKQSLLVGPGETVEKKGLWASKDSPETVFALWRYSERLEGSSPVEVPQHIEWEYLKKIENAKIAIEGDVVVLTIGRGPYPDHPGLSFQQFRAEPKFNLKITNATADRYFARVIAPVETSERGWLGGSTAKMVYEPLSPIYEIAPHSAVEGGLVRRHGAAQGSRPEAEFAIALHKDDLENVTLETHQKGLLNFKNAFIAQPNVVMSIEESKPVMPGSRYGRAKSDTPEGRMRNAYIKITELSREEALQQEALQRAALQQPQQSIYPMALLRSGEAQQLPTAPLAEPEPTAPPAEPQSSAPSAQPQPSVPPLEPGEEEK